MTGWVSSPLPPRVGEPVEVPGQRMLAMPRARGPAQGTSAGTGVQDPGQVRAAWAPREGALLGSSRPRSGSGGVSLCHERRALGLALILIQQL